jgi:hypothetical protein
MARFGVSHRRPGCKDIRFGSAIPLSSAPPPPPPRGGATQRKGALKTNVFTPRSPVANPKSGPDYSVFIMK